MADDVTPSDDDIEPASVRDFIGRGLSRLRDGQLDGAVEDFDAACRIDPGDFRAVFGRGEAWMARGKYLRAIRDFDEAARLKPEDAEAAGYRAVARHSLGDYAGAIADYDTAIGLDPKNAWLYKCRGVSLHSDREYRAAVADYSRSIELDPSLPDTHRHRGVALAAEGEYREAIADYTEALRLDPLDAEAYLYRAEALHHAGDHRAAITDFDEAIRLNPSQSRAYKYRAAAWDAMGRSDRSEADLDRAERLDEDRTTEGLAMTERKPQIQTLIRSHLAPTAVDDLAVTERTFPHRVRADLQRALDRAFGGETAVSFFSGVRKQHDHRGIGMTDLLVRDRNDPAESAPPHYEDIDVGDDMPIRCLKNGMWLAEAGGSKFVVFMQQHSEYGRIQGARVQVASPNDPPGYRAAQDFLGKLEEAIRRAESYRGKILSLESGDRYSGRSTGIKVHRLSPVERDQVILPARTLELLERNVLRFVGLRPRLSGMGLATKKGLLFYGPPGTGKTHTIQYLAGALVGHTTLLITAEQVGHLDEYMTLARLLQPSMVVIEDVDLIARDRTSMESPCEEVMLNKLLNEMDGLRTDAEILFVLTTNRPEALEAALASRPGRVDQAIEFPLPDEAGRAKLVRLYSRGMDVTDAVLGLIVGRTEGVTASFIKELMRRSAQFHLERDGRGPLGREDVEAALDELLFSGGMLNRVLLGGRAGEPGASCSPS